MKQFKQLNMQMKIYETNQKTTKRPNKITKWVRGPKSNKYERETNNLDKMGRLQNLKPLLLE